jgi:hypothetical protein
MKSNETTQAANPLDDITAALEKALHQASQQAEQTINDARKQADTIINEARTQANRIIADAQADARARDDMERASLAIQEHAAALHTIALGLTGHNTTPRDNTGNESGSTDDSATDTNTNADANEADESNTNANDASTMPPAPTATATDAANTTTPINTSRANTPTTRRADGTTRKLAPWEQPQDEPAPEPKETHASDSTTTSEHNDKPERADTTAPQWDAPLIIDAPLQL